MSKELDYLDKILSYQPLTLVERTIIECIKEKLQRLESIDNAEPSEALECLDKLAKQIELDEDTDYWEIRNAHKTVEQALLKAQKEHKALEIIKEKRVACDLLTNPDVMDYKKYNSHCDKYDFIVPLTEEEFDLLKEVLE